MSGRGGWPCRKARSGVNEAARDPPVRPQAGDVLAFQQDAARAIAAYLPDNGPVICTGAWATRDGSSGCVNSVAESLATRIDPARIRISESAAYEEDAFGFDADGLDL